MPVITTNDNLKFRLDIFNMTATLISSRNARGDIVIPRSIQYSSREFVIKTIGRDSFSYNGDVTSLSFSEDTEIQVFESHSLYYTGFQRIEIPSTVEKLCPGSLVGVDPSVLDISPNNPNLRLLNEIFLVGKSNVDDDAFDILILAYASGDVVIPNTIKQIYSSAFSGRNLHTITFQENSRLETIRSGVFANKDIQRIRIPSSVKEICDSAFENSRLSVVEFENDSQLALIGKKAFHGCPIESIIIPEKVKIIDDNAFFRCQRLSLVTFSSNSQLEKIGNHAFDSTLIETFELPRSVKYIGKSAFFECNQLNRVLMPQNSELQKIESSAFCKTPLSNVQNVDDLRRLQHYDDDDDDNAE